MKTHRKRHGIKLPALALALASFTAQAEQAENSHFIMTAYTDMAQGRAILNGAPDELIEELTRKRAPSLPRQVNLCVTYTRAKQIDAAKQACDAAVSASTRKLKRARPSTAGHYSSIYAARTENAVALSNRGVLFALTGETDSARAMFAEALEIDPDRSEAELNLELLERRLQAQY